MPHAFLFAARPARVPLHHCSKACFESRRNALRAKNRSSNYAENVAMGTGALNVYHCPDCGSWHVGHRPMQPAKRTREGR